MAERTTFSRQEQRVLARILAGQARRGAGVPLDTTPQLKTMRDKPTLRLLVDQASQALGTVWQFVFDEERQRVVPLSRRDQLPGGTGEAAFGFSLLLYLYYRQVTTAAVGVPHGELVERFRQVGRALDVRVKQAMAYLGTLGLVAVAGKTEDGAPIYKATTTAERVFSLPLLAALMAESQKRVVPEQAVAALFGRGTETEQRPDKLEQALAALLMAAERGHGVAIAHLQALLGVATDLEVDAALKVLAETGDGLFTVSRDPRTGAAVVLAAEEQYGGRTEHTADVSAALLMYLFYVQAARGQLVPWPDLVAVMEPIAPARILRQNLGILRGRQLVRDISVDNATAWGLTPLGWASFPPHLAEQVPSQTNTPIIGLYDVRDFFGTHLHLRNPVVTRQTDLFEEEDA